MDDATREKELQHIAHSIEAVERAECHCARETGYADLRSDVDPRAVLGIAVE